MGFRPLAAALLALVLLVGGALWLSRRAPTVSAGPLAGSGIGGPFALVDQDGRAVTQASFAGRYTLIYFGYTFCPDVCPTDLARNAAALRAFAAADPERAARVQPIFVTVDPARDTPAIMKAYAANFPPRLIGLTGTAGQVAKASAAYKVFASRAEDKGAAGYTMGHTDITYLMGPRGDPIDFFPGQDPPAKVAASLARYVR